MKMKNYYEVVTSGFHGHRLISVHRSPYAAASAAIRYDRLHEYECSSCGGSLCYFYRDEAAEPERQIILFPDEYPDGKRPIMVPK